ncbi:unnamed protein product, partial [Symbiodinium microadriaticum]
PALVDSPLPGHDSNDEPFGPTITPSPEGGIATPPPASIRSPAMVAELVSQAFSSILPFLCATWSTMASAPASGAAAASTGPGPSAPTPASGHAALPPVWDVLAELMQFPDEVLLPALRDSTPEDLMRLHDLLGSAFADRMGLTPLRFQNPPPDVDMEDKSRDPVPPAAPDANMSAPPAAGAQADPNSDLLGLDADGPPAPTSVPEYPPEVTRRSGYTEGGPLPNLGCQDHWNPAWLRQLDPTDLEQDSYDWVDVSPPLPRVMADTGPWSNREGWKIRVCSHIPPNPQTIRRPAYWPFADLFCIRPADHPSWLERQLDSPSLRPSLAAVQLRELLLGGASAVRSEVRTPPSVRANPSECAAHSPLQSARTSASWFDRALRSPSPLHTVSVTPPSQPRSSDTSAFELVSVAAVPFSGSVCPGLPAAAPRLASSVPANVVACPRRWADGRPNSAYRPRGFAEVRPGRAPCSPALRVPVSSATSSPTPPPLWSASPAPPVPRGTLPAHLSPLVPRVPFLSASGLPPDVRVKPVSPSSVHFPPVAVPAPRAGAPCSTAGRVQSAMLVLSARWVAILRSLSSASALFLDCQASSDPETHMTRSIAKFAPSTLERYLEQWSSWSRHCELAGVNPAAPPPGFLPDWIASRASSQGLATAPLKSLAWMCKTAGLPALRDALSSPLCRAFAVASAPSEHRESLPLSLSFVVWLEQSVLDP